MQPIYLDYNGTTPLDPQVIAAMQPFMETHFGNPSSSHWYGAAPKQAVIEAKIRLADLLHCYPTEIIFTSGGTESNSHAIFGVVRSLRDQGNHIITSQIEHPAILEVCRYLETRGCLVTYLPVDDYGLVNVADLEDAIRDETILISIMHANNEVGSIQPIEALGEVARRNGILFHTDAAQSIGKIPAEVRELKVDLLSVAGHKVYAPKGVGALYVRDGVRLDRFMLGAGQESGRRAGTENVIGIVGLGAAATIAAQDLERNARHMASMRDVLHGLLEQELSDVRLNGHKEKRLPNTLNISFKNMEANRILEEIASDVAASAGAACHSDTVTLSHVLEAMRVPIEWAKGTVRFSVGKMTTKAEIERAAAAVIKAVKGPAANSG